MIKSIQYLRFFAAMLVVIAHLNLQIYGIPPNITNLGGFGVDIFFVVSGFIMPYIIFGGLYQDGCTHQMTARSFITRRIIRIWPMYLITILTAILLSYLVFVGFFNQPTADFTYLFNSSKINFIWFIETMTFTHLNRPPIFNPGWTLQFEFAFYLMIGLLLSFKVKKINTLEFLIILLFIFLVMLSLVLPNNLLIKLFSNHIIFEFILGVYLYRLLSSGFTIPSYFAIVVILLTLPIFFVLNSYIKASTSEFYRAFLWGWMAFFLVLSTLSLEKHLKGSRIFLLLGDSSYSLYLTHGLVAPLFYLYWVKFDLTGKINIWIYLMVGLLICIAIGVLAHVYIEKRINLFFKSKLRHSRFVPLFLAVSLVCVTIGLMLSHGFGNPLSPASNVSGITSKNKAIVDVDAVKIIPSPDGAPIERDFKICQDASCQAITEKFTLNLSVFEGEEVIGETFFLEAEQNHYKTMFPFTEILNVFNPRTEEVYIKGQDYIPARDGILVPIKTSMVRAPQGFHDPVSADELTKFGVKVSTSLQDYQYAISYKKKAKHINRAFGSLKRLREKIDNNSVPLKVTFYGDSITLGANSTEGYVHPNQPGYSGLVMGYLNEKYPNRWLWRNNSVGGWNTLNAVSALDYRVLDKESNLVIIAFGMNDGVGHEPELYLSNVRLMIDAIKKKYPNASILLLNSFRANPDAIVAGKPFHNIRLLDGYTEGLKKIAMGYDEVAFVDITGMYDKFIASKNYYDLSGNGLNHPNDFGHRLMFEAVINEILGSRY